MLNTTIPRLIAIIKSFSYKTASNSQVDNLHDYQFVHGIVKKYQTHIDREILRVPWALIFIA